MATYIIYKDMMEQSTEINNIEITKRKKGRPKGIGIYIQKKKTKNEPDNEQDYIIHQTLKKNKKESV